MNCKSVRKSLSAYLDNEVDNEASEKITEHLLKCPECNAEFNKLEKVSKAIDAVYAETEIPAGLVEELINETNRNIGETEQNTILNLVKKLFEVFLRKKRLALGIGGVFILFVFVSSNWNSVSNRFTKGHPSFIIEEKQFSSIEAAQKSISQIPFLIPQKIKQSYKLDNITYSKDKENSSSVAFNYKDSDKNTLKVEYYSRGDNVEAQSDFTIVNSDIVRIHRVGSYNAVPPGTTPTEKDMSTYKEAYLELSNYNIMIHLNYSGQVNKGDISDDEMIAGIIEGFLNSQIFNPKDKSEGFFNSKTIKYNSFSEFKQNVQVNIHVNEPKYIPKGFKFKYIIYKGYNSVIYNIAAIYENETGVQLTVDYMTKGASSRFGNNNDKFVQRGIYKIKSDENGKVALIPYTERQYGHQFSDYDMNIYLQYKTGSLNYDNSYDSELKKIVESME